jgi:hypothetical protein
MSRLAAELPKGDTQGGTNGTAAAVPAFEIPQTHKAAIYDAPGTISTKVVELATPEPGSGQVLVRLTHSGVVSSFRPDLFRVLEKGIFSHPRTSMC